MQGKIKHKTGMDWILNKMTIEWPVTEVPRTWILWWFEVMEEVFPREVFALTWRHRKGLAGK